MDEITYKGFIVEAAPELHDGQWSTNICIRINHLEGPSGRNFSTNNTNTAREDAVAHCFQFGRDVIDGRVEGLTVEDL